MEALVKSIWRRVEEIMWVSVFNLITPDDRPSGNCS